MPSSTGIEIGPDSCVLVGVRTRRGGPDIFAARAVGSSEWPGHDVALAALLRSIRRESKLPRTARVVAWGLPEGARAGDPVTRAALSPLVAAGFRIDAVLSPPQALMRLAASRARTVEGAVAWLALNRSGAAIAIVRGAESLFSRAFEWSWASGSSDPRAELLQRYSHVSHLAPEVQRGIALVAASHGIGVETAVTCGDVPELRSLTMPLIEELDLEVETLDSMEGLRASGAARGGHLAELAPAIRLACAAAMAPSQRRSAGSLVAVAAAAVLLAGLGWASYAYWTLSKPHVPPAPPAASTPVRPPDRTAQATPAPARPSASPPAATPAPQQVPRSPADIPPEPGAAATSGATAPPTRRAPPVRPEPQRTAQAPPVNAKPVGMPPAPPERRAVPRPVQQPAPRVVALNEPVPVIEMILVDQSRRLAVIGGAVVAVGDAVGARTVAQIEPEFVMLKEPSGLLIRVPIRGKVPERWL